MQRSVHLVLVCLLATGSASAQQIQWSQSPINGHWYGVERKPTSWTQGEAEAVSLGGHLATVRSQAEQNWIATTFQYALPSGGLWFGLSDAGHEGTWTWASGESVTYTNWFPGQPQGGTSENYGSLYGTSGGSTQWSWHDAADTYPSSRALLELIQAPTVGWSWPTTYPTGSNPSYHCVVDVDADGKLDLVVPNSGASTIAILRNQGLGQFATLVTFATVTTPESVAAADFDHDGKIDLAVAGFDGQALQIHRGTGGGGFVNGQTIALGAKAHGLVVADFNSDGWADVALTTISSSDSLRVSLNNGAGVLLAPSVLATGGMPHYVSSGDFNGDGKPDLVVSNGNSNTFGVYLNDGSGGFLAPTYVGTGANPHHIGVGDLDGDGDLDLAVPNGSGSSFTTFLNDGQGTFSSSTGVTLPSSPIWIDIGDVNGDGRADIAAGQGATSTISIFENLGSATFATPVDLVGTNSIRSVVLADFDGDSMLDISATGDASGHVAVILNQNSCSAIASYCTSSTTSHGCTPTIDATGTPTTSRASGFDITVTGVEGQRNGMIFYGTSASAVAWAIGNTSYICVAPTVQRTAIINSGGTLGGCDGTLTLDFNAFMSANPTAFGSPFTTGAIFYAQGWFRDPGAVKGTNLSNGLRFRLCN